jgi:hypothetical protein
MTTTLVKELRRISEMDSLSYKDVFDSLERINEKPSVSAEGLDKTSDAGANEGGSKNESIISNAPNSYKNTGALMSNQSKNRSFFSMLPHLLSNIGLTCFQRSVYWAIKESSGEDGVCTKSNETLAKMSGMSKRKLIQIVNELCEKNSFLGICLITVKERYSHCGTQNTNEIQVANLWMENEKWKKNEVEEGMHNMHGEGAQYARGDAPRALGEGAPRAPKEEPHKTKNPYKERKETKEKGVSPPDPLSLKEEVVFFEKIKIPKNEYENLIGTHGKSIIDFYVQELIDYSKINPENFKKYKSHSAVIEKWIRKNKEKSWTKPNATSKSDTCNHNSSDKDSSELQFLSPDSWNKMLEEYSTGVTKEKGS